MIEIDRDVPSDDPLCFSSAFVFEETVWANDTIPRRHSSLDEVAYTYKREKCCGRTNKMKRGEIRLESEKGWDSRRDSVESWARWRSPGRTHELKNVRRERIFLKGSTWKSVTFYGRSFETQRASPHLSHVHSNISHASFRIFTWKTCLPAKTRPLTKDREKN